MADNGQPDPPDHAPIHGADRPAFQQHSNTADGVAATPPARENQVRYRVLFLFLLLISMLN